MCNTSMGAKNMNDFMKKYGYSQGENWNGITSAKEVNSSENNILDSLTLDELKYICRVNNLTKTGKKSEIISKILEHPDFDYNDYLVTELSKFKIEFLKTLCKEIGEKVKGTKKELVARICESEMIIEIVRCRENNTQEETKNDNNAKLKKSTKVKEEKYDVSKIWEKFAKITEYENKGNDNISKMDIAQLKEEKKKQEILFENATKEMSGDILSNHLNNWIKYVHIVNAITKNNEKQVHDDIIDPIMHNLQNKVMKDHVTVVSSSMNDQLLSETYLDIHKNQFKEDYGKYVDNDRKQIQVAWGSYKFAERLKIANILAGTMDKGYMLGYRR